MNEEQAKMLEEAMEENKKFSSHFERKAKQFGWDWQKPENISEQSPVIVNREPFWKKDQQSGLSNFF